jgi:hypothetical protein
MKSSTKKYTIRRKQRRMRRKSRMMRRKIYGGNGGLDTYASSTMNPGWAIGGMNNFVGPTQISMASQPVSMV